MEALVSFIAFIFISTITPGPNNFLLASSGLQFGVRRTLPMVLGIHVGVYTLIDLAGMEARREVISEMKAEMEEESSDVLKQLEELLANEEEMLKRAESLRKTGVTSLGEMHKAKSRVLELKIRLAEARQPKSQNSMFREELLAASLDRAQKRAMLAKIEELLEKFTSSRKILEQTRNAQEKLAITMDELNHLEKRVRQLTVELDYSKALLDSEKQENKKR